MMSSHGLVLIPSDYEFYGGMSARVQSALEEFAPEAEPYSIDEMSLRLHGFGSAALIKHCCTLRSQDSRFRRCRPSPYALQAFQPGGKEDSPLRGRVFSVTLERTVLKLQGIPCIEMNDFDEPRQRIMTSRSFGKLTGNYREIQEAIRQHGQRGAEKLRQQGSPGRARVPQDQPAPPRSATVLT